MSTSPQDRDATTAHLIQTAGHEIGHVAAHLNQLKKSKKKPAQKFNLEHASKHIGGAQDHIQRVVKHLTKEAPSVGKHFATLEQMTPQPGGGLTGLMNSNSMQQGGPQ